MKSLFHCKAVAKMTRMYSSIHHEIDIPEYIITRYLQKNKQHLQLHQFNKSRFL